MNLEVNEFSGAERSVKNHIVEILGVQWPLSIKKIFNRVKKLGVSVTYQAVHKSIKQLEKEGIIKKENGSYFLNKKWIKNMHVKFRDIEENYSDNGVPFCGKTFSDSDIKFFSFNKIFDMDQFNIEHLKNRKRKRVYTQSQHLWWSLFQFKNETKLDIPDPNKIYSICRSKSFVDSLIIEHEKSLNLNVNYSLVPRDNHDIFVVDDKVILIFYPNEFLNKLDKIYSNNKNVLDENFFKVFEEVFNEERNIFVCMIKNRGFSKQMKEVMCDAFR